MSVAQQARKILTAWKIADPARFSAELESARSLCRKHAGEASLEAERRELLETLLSRVGDLGPLDSQNKSANVELALLRHLSKGPANIGGNALLPA